MAVNQNKKYSGKDMSEVEETSSDSIVFRGGKSRSDDFNKSQKTSDNDLENVFDITSHRAEVSMNLDKPEASALTKAKETTIVISGDDESREITIEELKDLLIKNKNLRQIVVEEVKLDNASRYRMLFDNDHEGPLESKQEYEPPVSVQAERSRLLSLEAKVNKAFLEDSSKNFQFKMTLPKNERPVKFESPKLKLKASVERPSYQEDISLKASKVVKAEKLVFSNDDLAKEQPFSERSQFRADEVSLGDFKTHDKELVDVQISKHVLKRKYQGNKSKIAAAYYLVQNHLELYKLGMLYLEDFKAGLKSFAFNQVALESDQDKTILGIASFFSNHINVQPLVVTPKFENHYLSKFVGKVECKYRSVEGENVSFKQLVADGIHFIEEDEIKRVAGRLKNINLEGFLRILIKDAEIVLWDLPSMKKMDEMKEIYFPMIQAVENVSLLVKKDKTSYSVVKTLEDYFSKYGVSIKGLIFGSGN